MPKTAIFSISADKLMKLSKSVKQSVIVFSQAKLLRKLISQKTIFILLELMRDPDSKVAYRSTAHLSSMCEASRNMAGIDRHAVVARLFSPGDLCFERGRCSCLQVLETAFHIYGSVRCGDAEDHTDQLVTSVDRKVSHCCGRKLIIPDKRIVSRSFTHYDSSTHQAKGREVTAV